MTGRNSRYLGVMRAFGKAVRTCRTRQGYSQEVLADRAELDRSYMSQIERGIKNATLNSIWRISVALEVPPSELLSLTEQLAAEAEGAAASVREGDRRGTLPEGNLVLVVDDSRDICFTVESILRAAGFKTRQAASGLEAVYVLATEAVAAVVSDIRMEGGNGFELLEVMRQRHPDVPLFFMTSYDDLTPEDAANRGAAGLFSKPFDTSVFVARLKAAIHPAGAPCLA